MRAALLALALVATALAADPVPVQVKTAVEPARVPVGTPLRYTVEVTADPGVEVVVEQPTERIGDLDIIDFGVEPKRAVDGKTVIVRWFSLVGWRAGDVALPAPAVRWRRGEGEPQAVATYRATMILGVLCVIQDCRLEVTAIQALVMLPNYLLVSLHRVYGLT